jgi:hypothetical protein
MTAKGSTRLIKTDGETGITLKGAKFSLYKADGTKVGSTYTTPDSGIIEVKDLDFGDYYFIEDEAPVGYTKRQDRYDFTISETSGLTQPVEIRVVNDPAKIQINGTKLWNDAANQDGIRPSQIQVVLMANGMEVSGATRVVTADANGNWNYDFGQLIKYDGNGREINYTIVETVVSGYTAQTDKRVDANGNIYFVITNTHQPVEGTNRPPVTPPTIPPEIEGTTRSVEVTPTPTVNPAVLGARRMVLGAKRAPQVLGARRSQTGDAASMAAWGAMSGTSFAGFWAWIVLFLKRRKEQMKRRMRRAAARSRKQ